MSLNQPNTRRTEKMKATGLAILALLSITAASALAAEKKTYTEAEKAALREKRLQRTGGSIMKPGEGKVVIVNAQGKYASDDIERGLGMFREFLNVAMEVRSGKWSFGDKRPSDANVAVYVVDSAELPMSLVAMEEHWGVVNVSRLEGGRQFENEFARVVIATLGAGVSQYKVSPMRPISKPSDLDEIIKPTITMDSGMSMNLNLAKIGVTKTKMTTYLKACEEGWAPQPTNEYQKAIWEKVHQIPDKPMTIEFDPKKDK